jgi:hypothetical protein
VSEAGLQSELSEEVFVLVEEYLIGSPPDAPNLLTSATIKLLPGYRLVAFWHFGSD